jgi:CspA family cold shock protein
MLEAGTPGQDMCPVLRSCERHGRKQLMASGKVKWFDNRRGFGFIAQESGQDVFVHHSSILGKGYKILNEGETVKFEVVNSDKGPKAKNVERVPRQG